MAVPLGTCPPSPPCDEGFLVHNSTVGEPAPPVSDGSPHAPSPPKMSSSLSSSLTTTTGSMTSSLQTTSTPGTSALARYGVVDPSVVLAHYEALNHSYYIELS
jgi:hypothetical protein